MKQILFIWEQRHQGVPGMATEQQPILMILSTDKENEYPKYIKLAVIPKDNQYFMKKFITMKARLSKDRTLNTDGKTTFASLENEIKLRSEKIDYNKKDHRLKWLNTIVGNIKNNITGIYHGVTKQSLPLFLHEQEWRFNHRYTGEHIMEKVSKYLSYSFPIDMVKLSHLLDISKSYFSPCV